MSPVVKTLLIVLGFCLLLHLVMSSSNPSRESFLVDSDVLGSWISADGKLKVTFSSTRARVTVEKAGEPTHTAYFVLTNTQKGYAAMGTQQRWHFTVNGTTMTWTNGDANPISLTKQA